MWMHPYTDMPLNLKVEVHFWEIGGMTESGLSQFIQMKHPGFTAENGYIPESENNSVDTLTMMIIPSTI